jgi:hypothetical protein
MKFFALVIRKGIYPRLADADKIQVVDMDELKGAGFPEKRKEYGKKSFFSNFEERLIDETLYVLS